ncbi:PRC-barrel domain-containing protein [Burkholderia sp. 22PA0106]|uniref:PRC-barrel domain-containing protein n=1 Tax=Burkholderia sp. 22PA0106 TaxID=3237371 RepID=UPI0039C3BD6C
MTTIDPNRPASATPDGAGIVGRGEGDGPGPDIMAADTLRGDKVISSDNEEVGKIAEIMLDVRSGRVAYAVLSSGGFLGIGDSLRAIPWSALTLDTDDACFRLGVTADSVKDAPVFEKSAWPSMTDLEWGLKIHAHYHRRPYWTATEQAISNDPPGLLL